MLDRELVLTVPGTPAPKGSLKAFVRGGRAVLVEDNARTKPWRETVAGWAKRKWPTGQQAGKGQPVGVEVTLSLPRPATHMGTGRNEHRVKPSAPTLPVSHSTGDLDKHARLLLDALQDAGVFPDDCAVVDLVARKRYHRSLDEPDVCDDVLGYPGVVVRVWPLGDT